MDKKEIWVDIPDYEGLYKVSNFGNVINVNRNKILKINIKRGYATHGLCKNGVHKTLSVHRLVLKSFNGFSCLDINHIDGNKLNNNIENLEYCTKRENTNHAIRLGLIKMNGENNKLSKLNNKDVYLIRKLRSEYKIQQKTIATIFNISIDTVCRVTNNKSWRHL